MISRPISKTIIFLLLIEDWQWTLFQAQNVYYEECIWNWFQIQNVYYEKCLSDKEIYSKLTKCILWKLIMKFIPSTQFIYEKWQWNLFQKQNVFYEKWQWNLFQLHKKTFLVNYNIKFICEHANSLEVVIYRIYQ